MNYAISKTDDRDFDISILLWDWDTSLPKHCFLKDDEIQNQKYTDPYGCVFFTGSSISNTMNYIAKEPERISWEELCDIAIGKWVLDPKKWAYISSSPKLLLELGYIQSYWRCRTLTDVKKAIYNKKPVQTWSNSIDRSKTKANKNIVVRGNSYGHSFFICWYDDDTEIIICENSYWSDSFDNWYFYINYSDFDILFSSLYVMTDTLI